MANGQVVTNYVRSAVAAFLVAKTFYLGVGTGTTTPANADTALATEVTTAALGGTATYARASLTNSSVTTNVTNDTSQSTGTYTNPTTAANTIAVTECGIFDATSSGNMYFHAVFSAINLAPGFSITPTLQTVFA